MASNLQRPSIFVCVDSPDKYILREVLAGIEEEGIPYDIKEVELSEDTFLHKIYTESQNSRMNIAVGVMDNRLVIHYGKLPEEEPFIFETINSYDKEKARKIGCNAARLYKVMPFKN
ncbi:glycerol dehydratase reactivase beta/small subunit family protein [Clostridium sp. cel8]|jgi:hypothetical protein|uniref:glycerol dehydratase reactivase beta/small subunit family protein n=1 Tax=unclassified Clostridium TaxID=2614128 RepID=UPI001FACB548|nr:glycerol dehydratase reactivase beta/small subunit family protein [Clostridium sp. cel8]